MTNHNPQKPVIAILGGTGKEGPGLAMRWANSGFTVIIGSRQAEKAKVTAAEINAKLGLESLQGMQNNHAAQRAEISVLTVPFMAHQSTIESLRDDLYGKILVDATARVDFRDPRPPAPPAAARMAQEKLGKSVRVVAAFQNVPAHALKKNLDQPVASTVLVCSDDKEAGERVVQLAKDGGFPAFLAGDLDNAVVVEGLTCLLISLNRRYGVREAGIEITGLP